MAGIDILVRWVDDQDLQWQEEKMRYKNMEKGILTPVKLDAGDLRYRDWGLLKYWFRGIEKYAPWVRKVFFVTCNQKPEWLNPSHPKLRLVNHEDYIPAQWLPTFSNRAIDFNVFRIPDLSEQFVFFDDDMFIIRPTEETDFFRNGLPCDSMVFNALTATADDMISATLFNNMAVINKHFSIHDYSRKERLHYWYRPGYGKYLYKNITLSAWSHYLGFQDFHIPQNFLKETFRTLWQKEEPLLTETCSHRFRKASDVSSWLIRYWQLADRQFIPRSPGIGQYYAIGEDNTAIHRAIRTQKHKMICINEGPVSDFETEKKLIQASFESIFPEKSGFEK